MPGLASTADKPIKGGERIVAALLAEDPRIQDPRKLKSLKYELGNPTTTARET